MLAWSLALFGFIGGLIGASRKFERLSESVRVATVLVAFATVLAIGILAAEFLTDDYTSQYVWQFSNRDMPAIYKLTAVWGGMDGSMLLWAFMLTLSAALVAYTSTRYPRRLITWTIPILNSSSLFFLTVTAFVTNPFRFVQSSFIPPDGNGLNPLLQNPYMAVHPPILYTGFTTFAVPFAFCIGALLAKEFSNEWIRVTRRWTLVAWGFLTAGIVLGGHWAYLELGWGGFWAWDPVENASFLPWLTGTAYLHSVIVHERRGMLKAWTVWLLGLTYGLTVFGTFLTRSGVVQSVHAFASTDVGWVFLLYLGILFLTVLLLTFLRRSDLKPDRVLESFKSREAAFLLNNLIFLSLCFTILFGVMYPILSEAVTGKKENFTIPSFNATTIPLFLALLFLMGVGTLISWRHASWESLRKTFVGPFAFSLGLAAILIWAGIDSSYAILSYSLCFFVLLTIMGEFHRGYRAQRLALQDEQGGRVDAVEKLFRRHRTRYGGYLVHFGVIVVTVAITAAMAHKTEKEFTLGIGEQYQIGRFAITLDNIREYDTPNFQALRADTTLRRRVDGEKLADLGPEIRAYTRKKETTQEVSLRMGPREDVYLVLLGVNDDGSRATFKLFINPLQIWLWFGAMIMVFGTLIVLLPERRRVTVSAHDAITSPERSS